MTRTSFSAVFRLITGFFVLFFCGCAHDPQVLSRQAPAGSKTPPTFTDTLDEEADLADSNNTSRSRIENAAKIATGSVLKHQASLSQVFLVTTSVLNVRIGPSLEFKKVASLKEGALINVSQIEKEWAKIGDSRWVALRHLKLSAP